MAFDLSAADNILKTRYIGPIRDQLNNSTILMNKIMRDETSLNVSGKSFTVPLHTGRNAAAGVGASDGGALPAAGQQGYDVAVIPNKYTYGRIQVTGPTIRASRDNAGAFVRAVESEIAGVTKDMKRALNRQLNSDGADGLAFWTGADDTSGTTVDDNQGNAFVHLPASGTLTADLIDASNYTTELGSDIVVTLGAKNATTYDITWTGTVASSADGDYLVVANTNGKQLMGIAGLIDNADPAIIGAGGLQGLPVATKGFWKAQMFGNSGTKRDLTLARMQEPLSAIAVNSDFDEGDVKFLLTNYNLRDKYVDLLVAEKRFVNTMKLDGGFSAVEFNGIPLVPDPQCRRNTIWYIVPDSLRHFQTSDFDWMDKDGAVLARVSGYDAYEAVLFRYGNFGVLARNANAALEDITD